MNHDSMNHRSSILQKKTKKMTIDPLFIPQGLSIHEEKKTRVKKSHAKLNWWSVRSKKLKLMLLPLFNCIKRIGVICSTKDLICTLPLDYWVLPIYEIEHLKISCYCPFRKHNSTKILIYTTTKNANDNKFENLKIWKSHATVPLGSGLFL